MSESSKFAVAVGAGILGGLVPFLALLAVSSPGLKRLPTLDPEAPILFLGDSLTSGVPPIAPWSRGQVLGVSGHHTEHLLYRLPSIRGSSAELVVVQIGVNDLGSGASPAAVASGVESIVNSVRDLVPAAEVLVVGILPAPRVDEEVRDRTNALLSDLGAAYFEPPEQLDTRDGLHLSSAGYSTLAEALDPVVLELVGRR